jgi:hypothetical protein
MAKGKKSLKSSKQDVEIISPEGDSPVDDGEEPTPFLKISNLRARMDDIKESIVIQSVFDSLVAYNVEDISKLPVEAALNEMPSRDLLFLCN